MVAMRAGAYKKAFDYMKALPSGVDVYMVDPVSLKRVKVPDLLDPAIDSLQVEPPHFGNGGQVNIKRGPL